MRWIFFVLSCVAAKAKFEVNNDGSFSIIGTDGFMLESGNYMFRKEGATYSTVDKTLIVSFVDKTQGTDVMGNYTEHTFYMGPGKLGGGMDGMMAFIRNYDEGEFAIFRQHFHPGFKGMSLKDNLKVTTAFPSIKVPQSSKSFYINPCDDMGGYEKLRKGAWDVKNMTNMCASAPMSRNDHNGNIETGPFYIFDKTNLTVGHLGQVFSGGDFKSTMFSLR